MKQQKMSENQQLRLYFPKFNYDLFLTTIEELETNSTETVNFVNKILISLAYKEMTSIELDSIIKNQKNEDIEEEYNAIINDFRNLTFDSEQQKLLEFCFSIRIFYKYNDTKKNIQDSDMFESKLSCLNDIEIEKNKVLKKIESNKFGIKIKDLNVENVVIEKILIVGFLETYDVGSNPADFVTPINHLRLKDPSKFYVLGKVNFSADEDLESIKYEGLDTKPLVSFKLYKDTYGVLSKSSKGTNSEQLVPNLIVEVDMDGERLKNITSYLNKSIKQNLKPFLQESNGIDTYKSLFFSQTKPTEDPPFYFNDSFLSFDENVDEDLNKNFLYSKLSDKNNGIGYEEMINPRNYGKIYHHVVNRKDRAGACSVYSMSKSIIKKNNIENDDLQKRINSLTSGWKYVLVCLAVRSFPKDESSLKYPKPKMSLCHIIYTPYIPNSCINKKFENVLKRKFEEDF